MSLLPPNATALETALEAAIQQALSMDVPIDTLWHPEQCPTAFLPWLAWALSVDPWSSDWPYATQRQVIAQSVSVHQQKGTAKGMRDALAALDVSVKLQEWFATCGEPYTFTLTALAHRALHTGEAVLDQALYDTIKTVVDDTKPVRSHYRFQVGAHYHSKVGLATQVPSAQVIRLSLVVP